MNALLINFNMAQLINGTTNIGLYGESCIDLICMPNQLRTNQHGIIFNHMHNGIIWHNFIYVSINIKPTRAPRKIIYKRNFKHFNDKKFFIDATIQLTNAIPTGSASVNEIATNLESKINSLVDSHAPFKRMRIRPTRKPWITKELMKLISTKNRLFKQSCNTNNNDWSNYKDYRNYVLTQIRKTKKDYYSKLIRNSTPQDNWAVISELTNKHSKNKDIKELTYSDKTTTIASEIANNLNDFFSTVGSSINDELRAIDSPNYTSWNHNLNGFKIKPVKIIDITKSLTSLPNKKKGGVRQIPSFIYKLLTPLIKEPLTTLINKIIHTNTFPNVWKEALVAPIPKPGDSSNPSNYRPISSLPILSKIAERAIASQIRLHIESNNLISIKQYGFREKHSTQSLLLQLSNKWLQKLDNVKGDRYICLTALDIKKAFDTVDHELLMYKMANYFNFHPTSIRLMESYLTSRRQCVNTNGVVSNSLPIQSGVPQGSVLGPLLFIMFINDITKVCPCYLFADDCIIEQFSETPTLAINKTNNLLPSITTWYTNNLLKLNTKKTTVMIISNRQVDTNTLPHITIDGHNALFSPTMKYLGLIIDNSLNWNDHVASIKKKVMPLIWKFSQIRYLIDQATSRLYYTSLIRPHLEYAAATLFNCSSSNCNTLETMQNRCLRIIARAESRTSSATLREMLNIPTLDNRRKYFYLCELYKLRQNVTPNICAPPQAPINKYNLRSSTSFNLYYPRMNKKVGQRSLDYLGPQTYNMLPDIIKTSLTFQIFKTRLKRHLLLVTLSA